MRILHLSDIHYSHPDALGTVPHDAPLCLPASSFYPAMLDSLGDTLPAFEACLREGLAARPDVVVLTGDFVERGGADAYKAVGAAYRRISHGVAGTVLPCIVTPGNHDDRAALCAGWGEVTPALPQTAVRDARSPLQYVYEMGDVLFISFDTSEAGYGDGYLDAERLVWLRHALVRAREAGRLAVVCTHHHVDPGQSDMPPVPGAAALLDVLRDANAVLLNGHTHHQAQRVFEGVPYYTAGATSFQADPRDITLRDGASARAVRFRLIRGYNLYDVDGGRIVRAQTTTFGAGRVLGDMVFE